MDIWRRTGAKIGANNSFKQLADEWEKVNNWNRDKSRRAYISHIDKFLKVMGDLDLDKITKVMLYDFAEFLAKNIAIPIAEQVLLGEEME